LTKRERHQNPVRRIPPQQISPYSQS